MSSNRSLRILGIDPGLQGALSLLEWQDGRQEVLVCRPLPIQETLEGKDQLHLSAFREAINSLLPISFCVVEKQGPREGDRLSSVFTTARFFGRLEGALDAYQLSSISPTPQTWKKTVFSSAGVPIPKERDAQKQAAINLIRSRFPQLSLRRTGLSRADCDGMAESVCLCLYGLHYLRNS